MYVAQPSLARAAESWGAYFGIAGALLLATALPGARWGWVLFLGSNLAWLLFAYVFRYRKLLVQTAVFTASSILGIANSFYPGNPFQAALQLLFSDLAALAGLTTGAL